MQSPPFPRYLVTPRSKYSPQHHILKHPQLPFLPQCQRPGFTPIENNRSEAVSLEPKHVANCVLLNIYSVLLNIYIYIQQYTVGNMFRFY